MGTWSGQPFGNDLAADWSFELNDTNDWLIVRSALRAADRAPGDLHADDALIGIAAAEVVAHGLGHPTQSDAYTDSASAFVQRAGQPDTELVTLARQALMASTASSELRELWNGKDLEEWEQANAIIQVALEDSAT